jgi:hypothetical protein
MSEMSVFSAQGAAVTRDFFGSRYFSFPVWASVKFEKKPNAKDPPILFSDKSDISDISTSKLLISHSGGVSDFGI